ncbi:MAG: 50S ribosomal protein L22 [bacterium]
MQGKAVSKYIRISSSKLRQVISLIKGKRGDEAENILQMTPKRASYFIHKALGSAFANCRIKSPLLELKDVWIKEVWANNGPMMKRIKYCARGRSGRILKKTSHLTIVLEKI